MRCDPPPPIPPFCFDTKELSRRKSLLAWEDGEGVASDRSDSSPGRGKKGPKSEGQGDGGDEEEPGLSTG